MNRDHNHTMKNLLLFVLFALCIAGAKADEKSLSRAPLVIIGKVDMTTNFVCVAGGLFSSNTHVREFIREMVCFKPQEVLRNTNHNTIPTEFYRTIEYIKHEELATSGDKMVVLEESAGKNVRLEEGKNYVFFLRPLSTAKAEKSGERKIDWCAVEDELVIPASRDVIRVMRWSLGADAYWLDHTIPWQLCLPPHGGPHR